MKRKAGHFSAILSVACAATCLLAACISDEDYSTSLSDRLAFSADTVAFDTVISGQPANTRTFLAYNRNKKALRLPQIALANGAASDFRVNVDGTYLENGAAGDFEIAGEDSMRVFVEMTAKTSGSDTPVETKDLLTFTLESGLSQSVVLTAFGQDVIPLEALTIARDTLLDAQRPYQVFDSLVVASGATLTVAEGVRFYFHPDARLIVHGRIDVKGSAESPVVMRGDRLGNMFSDQPYDRIPGQWGGIVIAEESFGNVISHADIHSGTFGLRCDSSGTEREKLRLENSILHNFSEDALHARMANIFVGNTQITNAGGNCVTLYGGSSTFVHCTIGNFYAFTGGRGVALEFCNSDGDIRLPLEKAAFLNCIITGYSSDEIMGHPSERYADAPFNYLFQSCLLNTPEYEDERVVGCLWDRSGNAACRDENFYPEFDLDKLLFTFQLNAASPAVNAANPEITREYYPEDMTGRSRFADDGPDMGCYEREQPAENGDSPTP